jgi:hypothetical protein
MVINNNILKKRIALSPIISTIILTGVAITIILSVSYWMGGLSIGYTKFEKVDCISATPFYDESSKIWTIDFILRNSGTTRVNITNVLLNERSTEFATIYPSAGNAGTDLPETGLLIQKGNTAKLSIFIHSGGSGQPFSDLTARTIVIIKFISAEGNEYPKISVLSPP